MGLAISCYIDAYTGGPGIIVWEGAYTVAVYQYIKAVEAATCFIKGDLHTYFSIGTIRLHRDGTGHSYSVWGAVRFAVVWVNTR